jgi:hypothetical protein
VHGLIMRWWFWLGICFFHVAIAAGYLLIPLNPPQISQANFDKIKVGWTSDQVTELLGYYSFSDGFNNFSCSTWWGADGNSIEISFKSSINDGTVVTLVTAKQFTPTELSAFEQMKRRIEKWIREPRSPKPWLGPPVRTFGGIE